ncbi:MAG: DUF3426 domain-containing protein [Chloroflexota bacterium]
MLVVVWVPIFKALYAFAYPDTGGRLAEALLLLAGFTVLMGLPAFLLGFAARVNTSSDTVVGLVDRDSHGRDTQTTYPDDSVYLAIADELESGKTDKALWIRLFAQYEGDENKTKAAYIQQRAEVLTASENATRAKKRSMPSETAAGSGSDKQNQKVTHASQGWNSAVITLMVLAVAAAAYAVFVAQFDAVPDKVEQVDYYSILSSDMFPAPENPRQLILEAIISNHSEKPQKYPWLELTLTDSQEKPFARKTLSPEDYLGESRSPSFISETKVKVSLRLDMSSLPGKNEATGYRLYLFLPSTEPERLTHQINADALIPVVMPALPSTVGNIFDQYDQHPDSPESQKNAFGARMPTQDELQPIRDRERIVVSPVQQGQYRTTPVR